MTRLTCAEVTPSQHDAGGFLVSPEGNRVLPMCRYHAEHLIAQYAKSGEAWTFELFEVCAVCGGALPECGCHVIA
jgi:hypothetical protein